MRSIPRRLGVFPPVHHLRQRTASSCGLACIAMITGARIATVRRILRSRFEEFEGDYTDSADLAFGFKHFGIRLGRRVWTRRWNRVCRRGQRAVVAVRHKRFKNGNESWHWMIVERTDAELRVWDPMRKKGLRLDYKTLPLAWYHPLSVRKETRTGGAS
jgi:hypothetical protein